MPKQTKELSSLLPIGTCPWKCESWKGLVYDTGKKLGPVMLQFEYLNRQKMKSLQVLTDKLGGFFSHAPDGFEYAVEIRNPNYLKSAWFEFFASAGQTQQKPDGVLCRAASGIFVTGKGKTTFSHIRYRGLE